MKVAPLGNSSVAHCRPLARLLGVSRGGRAIHRAAHNGRYRPHRPSAWALGAADYFLVSFHVWVTVTGVPRHPTPIWDELPMIVGLAGS